MRNLGSTLIVAIVITATASALAGQAPGAAAPQAPATAQPPGGRGGQQGPQVISPLVNADRTVTVRLLAPKATEIMVTGEILNGGQPQAMTKGDDGIWTATLARCRPTSTRTRSTSTA